MGVKRENTRVSRSKTKNEKNRIRERESVSCVYQSPNGDSANSGVDGASYSDPNLTILALIL